MPLDTVPIELIAPTGNVQGVMGRFNDFASFSEIKLAVAHVSKSARHLTKLRSRFCTKTVAVVIN